MLLVLMKFDSEKIGKIVEKNKDEGNENFQFWLVTNTPNIKSEVVEYAKKNSLKIMIASIPSNWHRRSDWSISNLSMFENL